MKEYEGEDVIVIWKPEKCNYSGICTAMLPDVYLPNERPWIRPENASGEELIEQINLCPTGALTYRKNYN